MQARLIQALLKNLPACLGRLQSCTSPAAEPVASRSPARPSQQALLIAASALGVWAITCLCLHNGRFKGSMHDDNLWTLN